MVRRLTLLLLIACGILAGAAYSLRDVIATKLAQRALDRVERIAADRNVQLRDLHFDEAKFTGPFSIALVELRGVVLAQRGLLADEPERLAFAMGRVGVSILDFWKGRLLIEVQNGGVDILDAAWNPRGERIYGVTAEVEVYVNWLHPAESALTLETELRRLLREGRWNLAARITGEVHFKLVDKWHDMTVYSLSDGGEMRLVLDRADVKTLAEDYPVPLTEAEIDLVSQHPVLAPTIMRIAEKAYRAAEALRRRDPNLPFDAFRHVYWSYLLTKRFGPEFAEQVTDAHEIGATYENSEADRRMDLHNNAVGRAWALAGVPESEILQRVLTDEHVIRSRNTVVPAMP